MALVRTSGVGMAGLDEVVADARVSRDVQDKFGSLLSLYEQFLELPSGMQVWGVNTRRSSNRSYWLEEKVTKRLTNSELNEFLHVSRSYEDNPKYNSNDGRTGLFLTRLMQVAYEGGQTDFVLNMNGMQALDNVGCGLTQKDDKKMNVTIEGMVGNGCLQVAMVETVNIETAGNWCLWSATVGTVSIGTVGGACLLEGGVGTANIGTAGKLCLSGATVETANIGTAGLGFLMDAKELGNVYTSDASLVDQLKKRRPLPWKPNCGIHLISVEELEERMRQSRGGA